MASEFKLYNLIDEIDFLKNINKYEWKMKNGNIIKFIDMDENHINNVKNLLNKRLLEEDRNNEEKNNIKIFLNICEEIIKNKENSNYLENKIFLLKNKLKRKEKKYFNSFQSGDGLPTDYYD